MRRALGIGVLVVLAAFGALLTSAPPARAANVYVHLYGSTSGWSNTTGAETNPGPTIVTHATDTVTVNLTSDDGLNHRFILDYDGTNTWGPGEPDSTPFTSNANITFSSAPVGTYWYICTFHVSSMRGRWIVLGDTNPPWISALAANPPIANPGDSVNITVTAVDNESSVSSVHAKVLGPSSFDNNFTMTQSGATAFYYNRTYTANGTYTVTVWAQDTNGNFASRATTFTIGNVTGTRPWIYFLAATPSQADPGDSVNITARVTDNESAVTVVSVDITGPASYHVNVTMIAVNATDFYYRDNYTTNGTYAVTVWAWNVNNSASSRSTTFKVGGTSTPPTLPPAATDYTLPLAVLAVIILVVLAAAWWRSRGRSKMEKPPPS